MNAAAVLEPHSNVARFALPGAQVIGSSSPWGERIPPADPLPNRFPSEHSLAESPDRITTLNIAHHLWTVSHHPFKLFLAERQVVGSKVLVPSEDGTLLVRIGCVRSIDQR